MIAGKAEDGKLSPEQVVNWRRVLCATMGPYALMAPEAEIQALRDRFQKAADQGVYAGEMARRMAMEVHV
jgi:hypothetical protein